MEQTITSYNDGSAIPYVSSIKESFYTATYIATLKPGSRAWVKYKVNTMRQCPHLKKHREGFIYDDSYPHLEGHPPDHLYRTKTNDALPCSVCGWFGDGHFSPIKFLGTCGRRSNKKRDGLALYCMRAKTGSGRCIYHQAVYRKKNPWL
jgi:hypothetical protein